MALSFEQKKAVVAEVADAANKALAAVAAEYRGLTVEEMTELRAPGSQGRCFPESRQEYAGAQSR